jgi:hypothetical protein
VIRKNKYLRLDDIIAGLGTVVVYKDYAIKSIALPIVCRDGFQVSVQASSLHYCIPRNNVGPYVELELGFPNGPMPDYMATYSDGDTVWGYVPIDLVRRLIAEHDGEAHA